MVVCLLWVVTLCVDVGDWKLLLAFVVVVLLMYWNGLGGVVLWLGCGFK